MQFSVMSRTFVEEFLPLFKGAVGIFYSPSRQGDTNDLQKEITAHILFI